MIASPWFSIETMQRSEKVAVYHHNTLSRRGKISVRIIFDLAHVIHDRRPSPIFQHRISCCQVGPSHLQTDHGFTMGLILGKKQTPGLGLIAGTQARLLFSGDVLDEVAPALSSK